MRTIQLIDVNRATYFNYIEEKLNLLALRINQRGKLNILDFHLHSESFYQHFLNLLYDWNIENENEYKINIEAIDLIDHKNKSVFQVSATCTKEKIEISLDKSLIKDLIKESPDYTFKFISISKNADDLKKIAYKNPHGIKFNPQKDIIDIKSILIKIKGLNDVEKVKQLYYFIQKELGSEIDAVKLDSNLAIIIDILSKENWSNSKQNDIPFDIEKKISFNKLNYSQKSIFDYSVYHMNIKKKYDEVDSMGANKSFSILQLLSKIYSEERAKSDNADQVFTAIGERVQKIVQDSANFKNIEFDVLVLCVDILLVDAFIRCKIFENPENYNYATT